VLVGEHDVLQARQVLVRDDEVLAIDWAGESSFTVIVFFASMYQQP